MLSYNGNQVKITCKRWYDNIDTKLCIYGVHHRHRWGYIVILCGADYLIIDCYFCLDITLAGIFEAANGTAYRIDMLYDVWLTESIDYAEYAMYLLYSDVVAAWLGVSILHN